MSHSDFDDVLTDDLTWSRNFAAMLLLLEDESTGQLDLVPVDDVIAEPRYVLCARRGTHRKITECWMCWCDWAWGKADLSELIDGTER